MRYALGSAAWEDSGPRPPQARPVAGAGTAATLPGRDGHVPVHRHRGLDAAAPGARRRAYGDACGRAPGVVGEAVEARGRRRVRARGRRATSRLPDRAGAAVRAAVDGPARARRAAVAGRRDVRVRMGLHTGEAGRRRRLRRHRRPPGGPDRGRRRTAARCSSRPRRGPSQRRRRIGVSLRDLGEHRLKDLERRSGSSSSRRRACATTSRALRTLDARAEQPARRSSRRSSAATEIAAARRAAARTRLLTLTGPGRHRQDPPVARSSPPRCVDELPRRRLVRAARRGHATRTSSRPAIAAAIGLIADRSRAARARHRAPRDAHARCSSSTTSSRSSTARRVVAELLRSRARADGHRRPAGRRSGSRGEQEFPVPPLALPEPRRTPRRPATLSRLRGGAAVRRARAGGPPGLRRSPTRTRPPSPRSPPARRAAARDRARRRPRSGSSRRRRSLAGSTTGWRCCRRGARPARAPADAARRDRLEPRPARRPTTRRLFARLSACSRAAGRWTAAEAVVRDAGERGDRRARRARRRSPRRASCGVSDGRARRRALPMLETIREFAVERLDGRRRRGRRSATATPSGYLELARESRRG